MASVAITGQAGSSETASYSRNKASREFTGCLQGHGWTVRGFTDGLSDWTVREFINDLPAHCRANRKYETNLFGHDRAIREFTNSLLECNRTG